jgi:hypothetical protein
MATLYCNWVKVDLFIQPYRTKQVNKRKCSKSSDIFSFLSYICGDSSSYAAVDNSYARILPGATIFIPVFSSL